MTWTEEADTENHVVCPYQCFSPVDGLGIPSKGMWGAQVGRVSLGAAPRGLSSSSLGKPSSLALLRRFCLPEQYMGLPGEA